MPARDTQRSRVYKWERSEFGWDTEQISLCECQRIINQEADWLGIEVSDGRGCRKALARISRKQIGLPVNMRKRWVVLHEIAHFLAHDSRWAAHGSQFMQEYIRLLAKHYRRDLETLRDSAIGFGVRVGY
jgi:hypothetical protein